MHAPACRYHLISMHKLSSDLDHSQHRCKRACTVHHGQLLANIDASRSREEMHDAHPLPANITTRCSLMCPTFRLAITRNSNAGPSYARSFEPDHVHSIKSRLSPHLLISLYHTPSVNALSKPILNNHLPTPPTSKCSFKPLTSLSWPLWPLPSP